MKEWYSATDAAGLPELPRTESGVIRMADRESWQARDRAGRGGGKEYHWKSFPQETKDYLLEQLIMECPESICLLPVPAVQNLPVPTTAAEQRIISRGAPTCLKIKEKADTPAEWHPDEMKQWRKECMTARLAFIRQIAKGEGTRGGVTTCIKNLVDKAAAGTLPAHLQEVVGVANHKAGATRSISKQALWAWWGFWQKSKQRTNGVGDPLALAPLDTESAELPAWFPHFLKAWAIPQKPTKKFVHERMNYPEGVKAPSYTVVCRFLREKFSQYEDKLGRYNGAELERFKPLYRKDTKDLKPLDEIFMDGHSLKGYVAHPITGRPFHPELCGGVDSATKVIPGWSAGISESTHVVADCIRHILTVHDGKPMGGMVARFRSDGGPGFAGNVNADPELGRYKLLGAEFTKGRPGSPRGQGKVEVLGKSVWIPLAKTLPTYTGVDMDSTAKRKVYIQLQKELREAAKAGVEIFSSPLLPTWHDFLARVNEAVHHYNNRPHSALSKIMDPETGKSRHMTPTEKWNEFVAKGWRPTLLSEAEMTSAFRPRVEVTVHQGAEVRIFNNFYFHRSLAHHQGRKVVLAYEVQDPTYVWVYTLDNLELICRAEWNGNKVQDTPLAAIEHFRENRAKGRLKLVDGHREEILAELNGGLPQEVVVEHSPELQEVRRQLQLVVAGQLPEPAPKPPVFTLPPTQRAKYRYWCEIDARIKAGEELLPEESNFHGRFPNTTAWKAERTVEEEFAAMRN